MAGGTQGPRRRRGVAEPPVMAWRAALVVAVCLGLGFCAGIRYERFIQVDRCLDAGGRFDRELGLCER
jgi:hypothetical protein